ncbi:caspase-1-like [Nelusetta ayraudi]|uniref:caspase-1-like n=1 Tax=Nelusetta ayraudi TaxID=303726 RepID=UPI003F7248EB
MADKELEQVRPKFVENVSLETINLITDCILKDEIINTSKKGWILEKSNITADKARRLIDTVMKMGPEASANFISHVAHVDPKFHLALGLSGSQPAKSAAENGTEESYTTLNPCTETFWKMKQKDKKVYPADKHAMLNRVALLITNIKFTNDRDTRHGAEKDEENMEKLLKSLRYEVVKYTNLTGKQIEKAFSDFSEHPKLKDTDSVVLVIMSHGTRGKILGVNHTKETPDEFDIDKIYEDLGQGKCHALRNKPKIIIIQACRGDKPGSVLQSDCPEPASGDIDEMVAPASTKDLEEDRIQFVHQEKDFVSLLSSTVDCVSYRYTAEGSLLINSVVKVFNHHAHEDHVEELFTMVMHDVQQFSKAYRMQMPTKDRCTLHNKFYFYPGHW